MVVLFGDIQFYHEQRMSYMSGSKRVVFPLRKLHGNVHRALKD